jgi:uncharacterized protein YcnI
MTSISRAGAHIARLLVAALVAGVLAIIGSSPASAHASVQMYGETAKAGSYGAVFIRIPHGKPGLVTNVVEVQIPEGVTAVKPQRVAGWNEKVNYAADGKTAASVSWSGGELPDTSFMDFGISVKFPATTGATLYFKTVQTLSDGTFASWIEIPAAGVDSHSLSYPAPSVTLAAAAGHGHGGDASDKDAADSEHGKPAPAMTAEMSATMKGNNVRIVADTSTLNAAKRAVVRLVEKGKTTTVLTAKLDVRGDLVASAAVRKSGKGGYRIDKGDKLELVIAGKVVASAAI